MVTLDPLSQQLYGGWLAELRSGRTTGWEKYVDRVLTPTPDHRQAERFWAGHDLPAVLGRWGWTFRADRLHVLAPLTRPARGPSCSSSPESPPRSGAAWRRWCRRTPILRVSPFSAR